MTKQVRKQGILIAEDDPLLSSMLKQHFRKRYVVFHANNGQEALALVGRLSPDMILLDLNMPVMNGFEFLSALRAMKEPQRDVPVVVITNYGAPENYEKVRRYGVSGFLEKVNVSLDQIEEYIQPYMSGTNT